MNFSEEQILALAPDESSKKSGKALANPSRWVMREVSERALWGACKFPDLMAAALSKQDIALWASKEELVTPR